MINIFFSVGMTMTLNPNGVGVKVEPVKGNHEATSSAGKTAKTWYQTELGTIYCTLQVHIIIISLLLYNKHEYYSIHVYFTIGIQYFISVKKKILLNCII